jgi:hypothetical protein
LSFRFADRISDPRNKTFHSASGSDTKFRICGLRDAKKDAPLRGELDIGVEGGGGVEGGPEGGGGVETRGLEASRSETLRDTARTIALDIGVEGGCGIEAGGVEIRGRETLCFVDPLIERLGGSFTKGSGGQGKGKGGSDRVHTRKYQDKSRGSRSAAHTHEDTELECSILDCGLI